jgi:hypothetical protein
MATLFQFTTLTNFRISKATREALGNKPARQGSGFQMLGIDHRSADQASISMISPLLGEFTVYEGRP